MAADRDLAAASARESEAVADAKLIGHYHDAVDATLGDPLNDEEIKKGVMRARGWFAADAKRDVGMTVEMVDALALDVIRFAGEIVRRRNLAKNEAFADYVMSRLDP